MSSLQLFGLPAGARQPRRRAGRAAILGLGMGLLGATAWANTGVDGSVQSSASVVRVLSISSTTDLRFGSFAAGPAAGTVMMNPTGTRTATGGVTLVNASTSPQQATVTLTGTPSTGYSVALPNSVALTAVNSNATLNLGSFTTSLVGSSGSLGATGTGSFGIGGTLSVAANQATAIYVGSFTVTLSYY